MEYGRRVVVDAPFEETVERVRAAFAEEGFGVLTEIDVQATLKAKLDRDLERYLILGACNPALASRALDADRTIGLLLPCNVVVREEGDRTVVDALDPLMMAELTGLPEVQQVADEAGDRIDRALAALS